MIHADTEFKDLHRFITKELKPRMKAVKKEITKSISEIAMEGIQKRAPKTLDGYEKNLTNNHVKGDDKVIGYAILHRGKMVKGAELDKKTTLLYIKPIKRKVGKWTGVFRALKDFGPFTLDTWPVKIPKDKGHVVFQQTNERLVNEVKGRNSRELNELTLRLRTVNIRLSRNDFNVNTSKLDLSEDMAFRVIRKEKGIGGESASPHWRPGIEDARSGNSLTKILSKQTISKTLSDPNFRGWQTLGNIKQEVEPNKLEQIEKFQKMIIGE